MQDSPDDPMSTLSQLQEAYAANPEDIRIATKMGFALMEVGRNREAEALFQEILRRDPRNLVSHMMIAVILLYDLRLYSDAISYLQSAIAIRAKNPLAYSLLGLAYIFQKDYATAIDYLNKSLEYKVSSDAMYYMAVCLFNLGKIEESLFYASRLTDLYPDKPDTAEYHRLRILASIRLHGHAQALPELRRLTARFPDHFLLRDKLAYILLKTENSREALDHLPTLIAAITPSDPNWGRTHYNMGYALEVTGQWEQATDYFARAAEHSPQNFNYQLQWGRSLQRAKRFKEAEGYLKIALNAPERKTRRMARLWLLMNRLLSFVAWITGQGNR